MFYLHLFICLNKYLKKRNFSMFGFENNSFKVHLLWSPLSFSKMILNNILVFLSFALLNKCCYLSVGCSGDSSHGLESVESHYNLRASSYITIFIQLNLYLTTIDLFLISLLTIS